MSNKDQKEKWEEAFDSYLMDKYGVNPEYLPDYCEDLVRVNIARITWRDACKHKQKEIDRLKKQVEIAREALEFYAKPSVWGTDTPWRCTAIDPCDQEIVENHHSTRGIRGGKTSRQALEKLKELDKEMDK